MARKLNAPNDLPAHYQRTLLEEPQKIKFRSRNDTDGRGNSWILGKLYGWDSHIVAVPCPIIYAKDGGWRTLNPANWEWQ